ncbi:unnamed protein product [Closterium sp. Yama58-4]|nr:unnamed protein product [Closterium sp. Yama58-4]
MVIFAHHHVVMDALQAAVYRIAAASILRGAEGEKGNGMDVEGGAAEEFGRAEESEGAERRGADEEGEGNGMAGEGGEKEGVEEIGDGDEGRGRRRSGNSAEPADHTEPAAGPGKPAKAAMQFELVRVDGTTPPLGRAEAVKRFATEPQVRVAIVGVTAGGVGLDFSAAQTIVFAEIPRAAADLLQAEDRAHRRGQRFPVNVAVFCAKVRLVHGTLIRETAPASLINSKKEGSSAASPQLVDSEDRMPPILRRHVALREAARSFVSEWGALKPQHRRKLLGRILALPVAEELERVLFPLPFSDVMVSLSDVMICRTSAARAPTVPRHLFCSDSCFSTYLSRTSLSFLRQVSSLRFSPSLCFFMSCHRPHSTYLSRASLSFLRQV